MKQVLYILFFYAALFLHCNKGNDVSGGYSNTIQYNHDGIAGRSARDFLSSSVYKSLKIEIQYMPGFNPDYRAIDVFAEALKIRINKPSGIFIELKEIDPTLATVLTIYDIDNIESRNRTSFTNQDQMTAYILFASGSYYDGNVVGLAYKNTSICFFGETLKYFAPGVIGEDKVKLLAMLLTHEFGHLLGLVDMGTTMLANHEDKEHSNHCINSSCIMHHTYEPNTKNYLPSLFSSPSFDDFCIADMRANGGK